MNGYCILDLGKEHLLSGRIAPIQQMAVYKTSATPGLVFLRDDQRKPSKESPKACLLMFILCYVIIGARGAGVSLGRDEEKLRMSLSIFSSTHCSGSAESFSSNA